MISYELMPDIKKTSFLLRAPVALMKKLSVRARKQGMSLNQLCLDLLAKADSDVCESNKGFALEGSASFGQFTKFAIDTILPAFGPDLCGVILYGSYARGEYRQSSDIDLLVVLNNKIPIERDLYSRIPDTLIENRQVSAMIVNLPNNPRGIWLDVAIDGLVLFDKVGEVSRFLAKTRSLILNGEMKREIAHGIPYWVHCIPDDRATGVEKRN